MEGLSALGYRLVINLQHRVKRNYKHTKHKQYIYKNYTAMPKRNSPNDIKNLDDLNDLQNIVVDKRNLKRKTEKRNRRDRHYNILFIKIAIKNHLENAEEERTIL